MSETAPDSTVPDLTREPAEAGLDAGLIVLQRQESVAAFCDEQSLHLSLANGATITTPLWWCPRLLAATPEQRNDVELSYFGVHWEEIGVDLSVEGMLRGGRAPGAFKPKSSR